MVVVVPAEAVRLEEGHAVADPGVWYGQIGALRYHATIGRDVIESGPAWTPSEALPLTLDLAAALAHNALAGLVREPRKWALSEITLQRLRNSVPERWFFVVGFTRETGKQQGVMQFPVAFTGQVGTVERATK